MGSFCCIIFFEGGARWRSSLMGQTSGTARIPVAIRNGFHSAASHRGRRRESSAARAAKRQWRRCLADAPFARVLTRLRTKGCAGCRPHAKSELYSGVRRTRTANHSSGPSDEETGAIRFQILQELFLTLRLFFSEFELQTQQTNRRGSYCQGQAYPCHSLSTFRLS